MAAMPIYGKNLKKNCLLWNQKAMTLKVSMQHWVLEYYHVNSNNDPRMTFTYFMERSNSIPYAFVWEKGKTVDFFQKLL